MSNQADFVSIDGAAARLGVHRTTVVYYLEKLGISTKKFDLDRRRYIAIADFERIKGAKDAAAARASQEINVT